MAMKGPGVVQYGYPQYTLVSGSPRSSRSEKFRTGVCPALRLLVSTMVVVLLAGSGYILWPSKPDIDVTHVKLNGININFEDRRSVFPAVNLDISLELYLTIRNMNFFGVVYDKILAHVSYRGSQIGDVESKGGSVPARSEVIAKAVLDLKGKELFQHVSELLVDVANREVPLDTITVFSGSVEVFFYRKHIEVTVACEMLIDPRDKVVLSEDCALLF